MKSGRVKIVLFTWLHGGHHTAVQNRKTGWFLDRASSNARSTSATLCGRTHWIAGCAGLEEPAGAGGALSGAFEQADTRATTTSSRERSMVRAPGQGRGLSPSRTRAQRAATRAASAR
jgi:hypothetical protein